MTESGRQKMPEVVLEMTLLHFSELSVGQIQVCSIERLLSLEAADNKLLSRVIFL